MADPLSLGASVLAVVTATTKSVKALTATVKRYKERDKILNRLHHELEDVVNVLRSLQEAIDSDTSILMVLKGPIDRCGQVCREFEEAMKKFGGQSKTGFRDWAKMEFAREDINGFVDNLANYKATILVGLGTINMRHSKLTQQALEGYSEMIKDTSYNLEIRLRRIEAFIANDGTTAQDTSIDLRDEREVTRQCLRICEDAQAYIVSLHNRQPSLRQETASTLPDAVHGLFEAELKTSQVLNQSRDSLAQTIIFLQQRLSSVLSSDGPERGRREERLRADIDMSKQCLEVCKEASEQVRFQKIHTFGEVIAGNDTDQVVVTTLADLFDVRKVLAKDRTAQLVGSMLDETVQKVSDDRYHSRFGTMDANSERASPTNETPEDGARSVNPTPEGRRPASAETGRRPSPNEMRKRGAEGEGGTPRVGK